MSRRNRRQDEAAAQQAAAATNDQAAPAAGSVADPDAAPAGVDSGSQQANVDEDNAGAVGATGEPNVDATPAVPVVEIEAPVAPMPAVPVDPAVDSPVDGGVDAAPSVEPEAVDEAADEPEPEPEPRVVIGGIPADWVADVEMGRRYVALIAKPGTDAEARASMNAPVFVVDGMTLDRDAIGARSYGQGRLVITTRNRIG